ncbi:PREDICTED: cell surface glycoprotein CD200 receptor 1-like [Elephantulus edwardii]|uniref:cell surface glycoprotein CD200 receptor 1-like n=1 Tax=Elephantulus edwardii TaxID=28737 RepID=UPI0003F0EE1A|nr:PREDICTED: cell surface glycoprotein CD200 receptor 1-like [Elephantulus edwardii]
MARRKRIEMCCIQTTSNLSLLPILSIFLVTDSAMSLILGGVQPQRESDEIFDPENSSLNVLVDTKAVLSCPVVSLENVIVVTWKILFRDNSNCTKAHSKEKNENMDNCTDKRITWLSTPDQKPALQIDPVAIVHDGLYSCEISSPDGHFQHDYDLQVLVPPKESISLTADGTVLCKAVGGKPAAQISWSPERNCSTEQQDQGDGVVSVQSQCHWEVNNVTTVTCSVSHLTGNKSLSLQLHPDHENSEVQAN